jgi:hypothetical protein
MTAAILRRRLMCVLAAAALSAVGCGGGDDHERPRAGGSSPPKAAGLVVGIGEQQAAMFDDPSFRALGIKHAHLVIGYDALSVRFQRALLDEWMAGASRAGVEPFVSFGHSSAKPNRLPSAAEFRLAVRAFRKRYPQVTVYSPWNEINHESQPTHDNPRRAAQYYNVLREECGGCTVLAGDVLDQVGMVEYLARYRRYLRGSPRIWGLHNYADANRFRETGLSQMLAAVPGEVWLTETGGIVKFGRSFPPDEQRAARALKYVLALARRTPRVKRLYDYNWTGSQPTDRFDAGLIGPDGQPRPAYGVLKRELGG